MRNEISIAWSIKMTFFLLMIFKSATFQSPFQDFPLSLFELTPQIKSISILKSPEQTEIQQLIPFKNPITENSLFSIIKRKILHKKRATHRTIRVTTRITTSMRIPTKRITRMCRKRARIIKKGRKSLKIDLNQIISPLLLNQLSGNNNPDLNDSIFSDSYEDSDKFGPFATVIKELLLEAKEMAKKRYYEGSNLEEKGYHERVLSPTHIIYREAQGNQNKEGLKGLGALFENVLEKIIEHKQKEEVINHLDEFIGNRINIV